MYPTSATYKTAIAKNVRDVKITGTITLKDSTVINVTDEDIVLGSLYISEQCVSGEDIEIGNVYASELGLTLTSPPENPYSLDGARIIINYGLNVEPDPEEDPIWEYVPLGYFYVTEIERKEVAVNLKALDGLILFDVDLSGVLTTGTPYALIQSCCTKAGMTLATSSGEFATFANGASSFALPAESKIETCRDLIMWICQVTGTFARMNRMGQLEVVPITSGASVKIITKPERFTSEVSDFYVKVTKVAMKIGETEYSSGTDGMTLALEENPLMAYKGEAEINAALAEILDQVTEAEYIPYAATCAGDPALQAGDWVTLTDTGTLTGGDVESIVTHTTWRYRGPHEIKAVGKSGLLRGVQAQQQKTVSSIRAIAKAAQDLAQAANQSTQLINDAIGGHVLIRREPGGTNEILIMDNPDPELATKIWRWNLGGLGYSDNVTGADNPAREYDVAMTMDGAINANFITTGKLIADVVQIGAGTTFATGYDPSEKETPDGAQSKANAAANAAQAAAEAHADAKAEAEAAAAQAAAEETAQGYVSAETQARIAEAAANLAAAKSHADSAASSAESTAKTYASTLLQSMADGTYSGGTFIDGKSIISPTVVGLQGTFAELMAGDPFGARLELGESAGEPFLEAYDDGGDLRVKLLQDSLEFSANGVKGGKLEAEYFGAGGVEGQAGLLLSSTYSIKLQALYYAWMETYGAGVQCAGETVAMWGDSGVHALSPLCLREPNGSAANKQIDFWDGYSLYRDDAGAGGNNTRIWLNTPHAGEVVVGPRSGSHWLGQLRIRVLTLRIETGSDSRRLEIWGPTEPRIEPSVNNYGYVGGVDKAFKQMYSYNYSQASAREAKTNIEPVNKASCYSQLREMNFWKYNLKDDVDGEGGQKEGGEAVAMKEAPTYLGVIAEESPDIICDEEKKNINLYPYISLIGAAVQEMQDRLEVIENKLIIGKN